jgi:hypothetical protein
LENCIHWLLLANWFMVVGTSITMFWPRFAFLSLTASIIVGGMWGLFHLLLYIQTLYTFLPFLCLMVAFSIIMTWVFNHTGSVPLMVIMHASLDTIQFVSPVNQTASTIIAFSLISLVMWLIALFIILRTGPDLGRTRKVALHQQWKHLRLNPRYSRKNTACLSILERRMRKALDS